MGSAMSSNLVNAGFRTYGFDIDKSKSRALEQAGGVSAGSAAEVLEKAGIVITSLPSAAALHSISKRLKKKGGIVIETSTLPIDDKLKARDTLKSAGVVLLDCPLSGTGAQARNKDLSVYASGDKG